MFKQLKSAIIWTYIYRYRAFLLKVLFVMVLFVVIEFLYKDITEYLRLAHKVHDIPYLLAAKWLFYLAGILYLLFSAKTLHKKRPKKSDNEVREKKEMKRKRPSKKEIAAMAQQIIEKKRKTR